jgi:hypothetical protein
VKRCRRQFDVVCLLAGHGLCENASPGSEDAPDTRGKQGLGARAARVRRWCANSRSGRQEWREFVMAEPKRLATLSVAPLELEQIRGLLERIRGGLPQLWVWGVETDADALIIDVDSVYGHMDWLRAHAAGRKIISLTSKPGADDDVPLLRPISAEGLSKALRAIGGSAPASSATSMSTAAPAPARPKPAPNTARVGAANAAPRAAERPTPAPRPAPTAPAAIPAAPAPAPAMASPVRVEPTPPVAAPAAAMEEPAPSAIDLSLADFCSADSLPLPARLVRGDAPALTIDTKNEVYYGPASLKALSPYCQGTVARSEWEPVSPAVMEGLRASGSAQPLTRLLWLFALTNSKGELMPGLDVNGRFKLGRWPQIEREFPKHFRIATVMMKGHASLNEIAEQSGATLGDVFDFVNAYMVTGFAEVEGTVASAEPSRGWIGRLRARVRRS